MQEKKQINIEIGARIKEEREKAGLTQERFSELIDAASDDDGELFLRGGIHAVLAQDCLQQHETRRANRRHESSAPAP